jgi:hypothetical protein
VVRRLGRRLGAELAQRDDALRKAIEEIEARVIRLRAVLDDLDRSRVELRFLLDAVEADLGRQFEQYRARFVCETVPELQAQLSEWMTSGHSTDRSLRSQALEEARRLSVRAVDAWLRTVEPKATALYVARLNGSSDLVTSTSREWPPTRETWTLTICRQKSGFEPRGSSTSRA